LTATCVIYGAVPEGSVVPIEYVIEITLSLGFDLDDKTVGQFTLAADKVPGDVAHP